MLVYPFPQNSQVLEDLSFVFDILLKKKEFYKMIIKNNKSTSMYLDLKQFNTAFELEKFLLNNVDYFHINYLIYPREIFPIEKEFRGIIYKKINNEFKVISRPLHKFYNQNEGIFVLAFDADENKTNGILDPETNLEYIEDKYKKDGGHITIEEKEDGSMIQIFIDDNSTLTNSFKDLVVNTKGTLERHYIKGNINNLSHNEYIVKYMLNNNPEGFKNILKKIEKEKGEKLTFLFEYISPNNEKHVVKYNKDILFLIDIRGVESGRYFTYKEKEDIINNYFQDYQTIMLPVSENFGIQDLDKKRANVKYKEGWVVKYIENSGKMHYIKSKTEWYLNSAISNVNIDSLGFFNLLSYYYLYELDTLTQKLSEIKSENFKIEGTTLDEYRNQIGLSINSVVQSIAILENIIEDRVISEEDLNETSTMEIFNSGIYLKQYEKKGLNINEQEEQKYLNIISKINFLKAIDYKNNFKIRRNKEYLEDFLSNKLFNKKLIQKSFLNNILFIKNNISLENINNVFNMKYIEYNKIDILYKIVKIFIELIIKIDIKLLNKKIFIFLLQENLFNLLEQEGINKSSIVLILKNNNNHISNGLFLKDYNFIGQLLIEILSTNFFDINRAKVFNNRVENLTMGNVLFDDIKLINKYDPYFTNNYNKVIDLILGSLY